MMSEKLHELLLKKGPHSYPADAVKFDNQEGELKMKVQVKQKSVWKVTGYLIEEGSDENIFEAYFSDRDTAHAVYHKGEREYGMAVGYTNMRWSLEGFYLDDDPHIDQMFQDVREAMEE